MQLYKLGKLAPKKDDRTLLLAKYFTDQLPAVPTSYDWVDGAPPEWGMMGNDTVGDCTCASAGHLLMLWTDAAGDLFTPTDEQILAAYSAITGYTPGDSNTDTGAAELDVLNYWKKKGIAGHQIGAYAAIDKTNTDLVTKATYIFCGAYIGLALPQSAQDQDVWDTVADDGSGASAAGSWGGHAVPVVAYDENGVTIVTWGALKKMTWAFWNAYCEEAYVIISPDFLTQDVSPVGIDLASLQSDLAAVTA